MYLHYIVNKLVAYSHASHVAPFPGLPTLLLAASDLKGADFTLCRKKPGIEAASRAQAF